MTIVSVKTNNLHVFGENEISHYSLLPKRIIHFQQKRGSDMAKGSKSKLKNWSPSIFRKTRGVYKKLVAMLNEVEHGVYGNLSHKKKVKKWKRIRKLLKFFSKNRKKILRRAKKDMNLT